MRQHFYNINAMTNEVAKLSQTHNDFIDIMRKTKIKKNSFGQFDRKSGKKIQHQKKKKKRQSDM